MVVRVLLKGWLVDCCPPHTTGLMDVVVVATHMSHAVDYCCAAPFSLFLLFLVPVLLLFPGGGVRRFAIPDADYYYRYLKATGRRPIFENGFLPGRRLRQLELAT